MSLRKLAFLLAPALASTACADTPVAPLEDGLAAFAKGKPVPPTPAVFTITDNGADVLSDGLGAYRDGECGVVANINRLDDGRTGANLSLSGSTGGCARAATLQLLVRHVSDNPHVDDATAPLGHFAIGNLKNILDDGIGVVNAAQPLPGTTAPTSCFDISKGGKIGGRGLRFDAVNFPGSNSLVVTQLGTDHYRLQTAPYPNNLGYCESNGNITYWHVVMDVEVRAKN